MDKAEARRCINAIADYLRRVDDSPRAADDLHRAVRILVVDTEKQTRLSLRERFGVKR